eukprot:scpid87501/ scgid28466/ 
MVNAKDLFAPLEEAISRVFIPSLTGRPPPGEFERNIMHLPCRLGGLGAVKPHTVCRQYVPSITITQCLVQRILDGDEELGYCPSVIRRNKAKVIQEANTRCPED